MSANLIRMISPFLAGAVSARLALAIVLGVTDTQTDFFA